MRQLRVWCLVLVAVGFGAPSAVADPARQITEFSRGLNAAASAHIYWSDPETSRGTAVPGTNAIGRANRNGTAVQKNFIDNQSIPGDLAVGAGHLYWIEAENGTIARANLDGSHFNSDFLLAGGLATP